MNISFRDAKLEDKEIETPICAMTGKKLNEDNYAFVPGFDFLSDFVYSANSSCIESVICNGEFVMEGRIVPGEAEIIENVKRICKKLYK